MTMVKICGLTEPDTLRVAARAGADWIGFVFVEASPRYVTLEAATNLLLHMGEAKPVALLADASDDLIDRVAGLGIRILQLHGQETPQRVTAIKTRTGLEVWKAFGVQSRINLEKARDYRAADRLLLDAKPPANANRAGGHGVAFDWSVLEKWDAPKPWILAGGLTPETVGDAIRCTGAHAVDVSTGVEAARGVKSAALIKDFINAAKSVSG